MSLLKALQEVPDNQKKPMLLLLSALVRFVHDWFDAVCDEEGFL